MQDLFTNFAKKLEIYYIHAVGVKMHVKKIDNEGVVVEINKI